MNQVTGAALWQQARSVISGGTGLLSKRAERFDPEEWPAYFSRCEGCEVWDLEGRRYVDFAGGIGAILLGYSDPEVNAAVQQRISAGNYCSLVSPDEVRLAERLLGLHPWAGKVRFARGGGEALAIAVRIARAKTDKSALVFCGYHGWQDWYLAANLGTTAELDGHLLPGLEPRGVPRELEGTAFGFRYNDLESFEAAVSRAGANLAAVVMEPMRGQLPREGFLETITARCRERGAVLVLDEVTSGWRFGWPGAHHALGIEPDIVVYAKALSNGFPCAAVVGRAVVMDAAEASFISSSYWTDGIGPAAALATLRKMEDCAAQIEVRKTGEALQRRHREVSDRHPHCHLTIEGLAPSPALRCGLGSGAPAATLLLTRGMLHRGFLIGTQIYLMLAHTPDKVSLFVEALEETLGEIEELIGAGRLESAVETGRLSAGFQRLN